MDRKERLQKAINYLRLNGIVSSQVDTANKMGASEATVSNALKGNDKYLTDKFLKRFNGAFGGLFNLDWLLDEEGEMLNISTRSEFDSDTLNLDSIKASVSDSDKVMDVWLRFMENQRQYNEIMREMAELYKQIKGE